MKNKSTVQVNFLLNTYVVTNLWRKKARVLKGNQKRFS